MGEPSPIEMQPGVLKIDAKLAAQGRYIDADRIRFIKGFAQVIGGWVNFHATTTPGVTRTMMVWSDVNGNFYLCVASTQKVLVYTSPTLPPLDITPYVSTGNLLANPFATTISSTLVTVTHSAHGRFAGEWVSFSGASAGGGITINGPYQVVTVVDGSHYTINHSVAATSTAASTGGGAVVFSYELGFGNVDAVEGISGGWSDGGWSSGPWGGASPVTGEPRIWSLDLWGTILTASYPGGTLYQWTPNPSSILRLVPVTNAPISMRYHLVTESRFILTLGTDDPLSLTWQDQNTMTDWVPTTTNTAGARKLQGGTRLMAGVPVQALGNLLWTDTSVFLVTFTGSKFVFDSQQTGKDCGLIGMRAFAMVQSTPYWMSKTAFYRWVGYVDPLPRQEEIWDWLQGDLNSGQATKAFCAYDANFNELTWYYPQVLDREPTRYIKVSLDDWTWVPGTLARTAVATPKTGDTRPLMISTAGQLYRHESDYTDNGVDLGWYLQAAPQEIANGKFWYDVNGFMPDFMDPSGIVNIEIKTYDRVTGSGLDAPLETQTRQYVTNSPEGVVDFSANGRAMAIKLSSGSVGSYFRQGLSKLEVQGRGTRR